MGRSTRGNDVNTKAPALIAEALFYLCLYTINLSFSS